MQRGLEGLKVDFTRVSELGRLDLLIGDTGGQQQADLNEDGTTWMKKIGFVAFWEKKLNEAVRPKIGILQELFK